MKNKFSWRALISFILTWIFFILLITGIILYIAPPGRYANWVNWKIFALNKGEWQALHTIFSFTFIIISILHLFIINWRVFLNYFKTKTKSGLNRKWELVISLVLVGTFFAGILFWIPPFSSVMLAGENLKNSWEEKDKEPPVPHAELLTLTQLVNQLKLKSAQGIALKLKNQGITVNDTFQTLQEIAALNGKTPELIYEKIVNPNSHGLQQGAGVGRKTISDLAAETGKSVDEILKAFKDNGIDATKDETLKQIGDKNNITPRELFEMMPK